MMKCSPRMGIGAVIVFFFFLIFTEGCGPQYAGYPDSILDTPDHYAFNGFRFLQKELLEEAEKEFERALKLESTHASALRGMGLVKGAKGDFNTAFSMMDKSLQFAAQKEERAMVHASMMHLYTLKRDAGWMGKVEEHFSAAISITEDLPEAHFELGIAREYAYRFEEARKSFVKVISLNHRLVKKAEEEIQIIIKIEKAMPRSKAGREIAFLEQITRADASVLLIEEMKLGELFKKEGIVRDPSSGVSPQVSSSKEPPFVPLDVLHHPARKEIEATLRLQVQGIRLYENGKFNPDEFINRAAFATMMADILVTLKKMPSLTTKYHEGISPYRDVRKNAPFFTAIMICTQEGEFMEGKNGIFDPMGTISGSDALLILKRVKEHLGYTW